MLAMQLENILRKNVILLYDMQRVAIISRNFKITIPLEWYLSGIYLLGRGTARSSNQAPNNAIDTKQKAHKQE